MSRSAAPELVTSVVTALPVPPKPIVPVVTVPDAPTSRARSTVRPTRRSAVSTVAFGNAVPEIEVQLAAFAHDWVPPPRTFHVKSAAEVSRDRGIVTAATTAIAARVLRMTMINFLVLRAGVWRCACRAKRLAWRSSLPDRNRTLMGEEGCQQGGGRPGDRKCDETGMGRDESGLVARGCAAGAAVRLAEAGLAVDRRTARDRHPPPLSRAHGRTLRLRRTPNPFTRRSADGRR